MPRTKRKELLNWAQASLDDLDVLDMRLYQMELLAADRQPAPSDMKAAIIEAHEIVRILWRELKSRL